MTEQARNTSVAGFAIVCGLELGKEPSAADVLAEIELRERRSSA